MTPHEIRQIRTAHWHALEAIIRAARGDFELEAYHIAAGREYLHLATGAWPKCETTEDLIAECLRVVDAADVLLTPGG